MKRCLTRKKSKTVTIVFNLRFLYLCVDKRLEEKINEKIEETLASMSEVHHIAESLDKLALGSAQFKYGIIIGRLYNSFHYQSRRILKRDPTPEEFEEFTQMLRSRQDEILSRI